MRLDVALVALGLARSRNQAASLVRRGHVSVDGVEIRRVSHPVAEQSVIATVDDPLHPLATAESWLGALPRARLESIPLAELGAHPAVLSAAGLRALTHLHR